MPTTENGTIFDRPPRRRPNSELRPREYLTPGEVEQLITTARRAYSRMNKRNAAMILISYRHGLRAGELCALRWDQIDLTAGLIHVNRLKGGVPSVHPLRGPELRALRPLQFGSGRTFSTTLPYVFYSERGGPITPAGWRKLLTRIGERADMPFPIHPHMLRHACGYKLANDGQDTRAIQHYLGHRSMQSTMRYTELAPDRFKDFWKD